MKFIQKLLLAAAVLTGTLAAHADTYPSHAIRLIVPFPAGGATDIFARAVMQEVGKKLGGSIFVDNKPGAGGVIGSEQAKQAAPDGYTLLLATSSTHSIGPILQKLPYDPVADFTPISHVGDAPSIMLVPNSSPAHNVKEFIEYARKNPGKLNFSSSGTGTIVHLTAEAFNAQTGLQMVHIPYKGTALAIPDLTSGKINVMFDALPSGLPHVQQGTLRALGITSAKRSALLPNLPAISETVPGFDSVTWFGLYGPKGLSPEVVAKLNNAVNEALKSKEVKDRLAKVGIEPVGGTPQQFVAMTAADRARWKKLIADRHITLE
jgi:tripartite-type tricarboxylate transporter receptor subunit TctC